MDFDNSDDFRGGKECLISFSLILFLPHSDLIRPHFFPIPVTDPVTGQNHFMNVCLLNFVNFMLPCKVAFFP